MLFLFVPWNGHSLFFGFFSGVTPFHLKAIILLLIINGKKVIIYHFNLLYKYGIFDNKQIFNPSGLISGTCHEAIRAK